MINDYSFAPQTKQQLKELGLQKMAETRPTVLYGDLLACDGFNVTELVATISTPTLVLCGAEDKMTPLTLSEFLRDGIPGAAMKVLPDAGHMAMLEKPESTAELLAGFLNAIPYRPGQ
jgi:3-oxoadipate enol-lactonase